eukprot:scaffold21598_cov107-Isochrysis_galbana.AAC.4
MAGHCARVHVLPVPACYVRPNLPVCVLLALHSRPHRSCFSAVLPAYLSSTACRFCACYDCSTDNPAITQPRHHTQSMVLGSASLFLVTTMPGSIGWSLALALLPTASAAPQPWYYALHVPKRGYAVFTSWDLCSGHGAIGGSGAIHNHNHKKFRSLDDAIEFATFHVSDPTIPLMDVWYSLTPGAQPVPATTAATQQLQLISPPPSCRIEGCTRSE